MTSTQPIGFVGIGNMGGAMAGRVLREGVAVVAFDPSAAATEALADAGATIVASPKNVAERCRVVSVVVNNDAQAREAVLGDDGVLAGSGPETVIAIHSTIHLDTLEELAAAGAERGADIVDAAVTGGVSAANRGELAVLLGGSPESAERARPALEAYASLVWHAGPLGSGMAAKISIMVISFGKLAASYEGLRLADAAGLDTMELAKIVAHSEAQSGISQFFMLGRADAFRNTGDDQPIRQAGRHESPKSQKDLHAALELAARLGIDLPLTSVAHDEMPAVWALKDS